MNDTISVAGDALGADPHRRGGGRRRRMAIAAAGLAMVAAAVGVSDRATATAADNVASAPGFAGYVKHAELGKMAGEITGGTAPGSR